MHSLVRGYPALCIWSALLVSSCTFTGDGDPWGEVAFDVEASFQAGERLESGRVLTSRNYSIEVSEVELHLGSVTLNLVPAGTNQDFDPANPPEGFSLCHNGHCHADSGELVSFEDVAIIAAQREGDAGGVTQAIDARMLLSSTPTAVPLSECSDACQTNFGELASVDLNVVGISFEGRVFDTLQEARLSDEGVPISATIPLNLNLQRKVGTAADKSTPVGIGVDVDLVLDGTLFDKIEWADLLQGSNSIDTTVLQGDDELNQQMIENFERAASMVVATLRQQRR